MDKNAKTFAILALFGIIGILFAIILQMLYEQNIIVPSLLTGGEFTLREIQFGVILIWEVVGVAIAAIES